MSELQTLKRSRLKSTHSNLQGRLILQYPEDDLDLTSNVYAEDRLSPKQSRPGVRSSVGHPHAPKLAIEHPPAYRKVVAGWSDDWRERWGLLANSLEESGLSWRDAESQAFVEIWKQIRVETDSKP